MRSHEQSTLPLKGRVALRSWMDVV